ncbi:unnamed protein product [Cyprideis torosa]|uniref:Uncharacterized protein n=1 Tax=Cyprideis torosa TaxID=163714 RepID=A0A7R8WIL4_9CRUS|nr:unnamed protein product [Cyprideis torosa]CAG0894615.1 unnamed protein product [Cyprideis torosa]
MRKFWKSRSNGPPPSEPCEPVETDSFTEAQKTDPTYQTSSSKRSWRMENGGGPVAYVKGLPRFFQILLIILVLLVLLLLIVIIVLASHAQGPSFITDPTVCVEPACLRASAFLQSSLNDTGDASVCSDVWGFSCGRWMEENAIPPTKGSWGVREQMIHQTHARLREMLNTFQQPLKVDSVEYKLKSFYDSCMSTDYIDSDEDVHLRDATRRLGGWALLNEWTGSLFDYRTLLRQLHSEFDIEPFFSVRTVPDDREPGRMIIKILPTELGLPDKRFYTLPGEHPIVKAYRMFLKDAGVIFGSTSPAATRFANNVFGLEQRIAEVTPDQWEAEDPVGGYNLISIRALNQIARSIPWLELLRELYPRSKIELDTDVLIVSKEHIMGISGIFFASDLSHPLGSMYTERHRSEDAVATVESMFTSIRRQLIKEVDRSSLIDPAEKGILKDKLRRTTVQVGYPAEMKPDPYMATYMKPYSSLRNAFYKNLISARALRIIRRAHALEVDNPPPHYRWMDALTRDKISYIHQANILVVPDHLLQPPFFDPGFPRSYLYGSFGVPMSSALTEAVSEVGLQYTGDGIQVVPLNSSLISHLDRPKSCLQTAFIQRGLGELNDSHSTVNCTLRDVAGARLARDALMDELNAEGEKSQPGLPYSPPAIFYITYGYSMCGASRSEQATFDGVYQSCLPHRERLESVVVQIPAFRYTFGCPSDGGAKVKFKKAKWMSTFISFKKNQVRAVYLTSIFLTKARACDRVKAFSEAIDENLKPKVILIPI